MSWSQRRPAAPRKIFRRLDVVATRKGGASCFVFLGAFPSTVVRFSIFFGFQIEAALDYVRGDEPILVAPEGQSALLSVPDLFSFQAEITFCRMLAVSELKEVEMLASDFRQGWDQEILVRVSGDTNTQAVRSFGAIRTHVNH